MEKILQEIQKKYLDRFIKERDPLLTEMETYAAENRVPILSAPAADLLELMIKIAAPKRALEIGTAIGYSSIRIAANLSKKGILHTIEKSEDNILKAEEYIQRSGFEEKIKILKGEAETIMPRLEKKYDFIFLDADKQDYLKLFQYSLMLLKKKGIIFIDNLLWQGYAAARRVPENYKNSTRQIKEFNEYFMKQNSLRSIIIPVGDGIGIGIKE
jgi:predicted O-methyltransferase YrrM